MAENTTFDNQTDESPEKQEMTTKIGTVVYAQKSLDESDTAHVDSTVTLEFGHSLGMDAASRA